MFKSHKRGLLAEQPLEVSVSLEFQRLRLSIYSFLLYFFSAVQNNEIGRQLHPSQSDLLYLLTYPLHGSLLYAHPCPATETTQPKFFLWPCLLLWYHFDLLHLTTKSTLAPIYRFHILLTFVLSSL